MPHPIEALRDRIEASNEADLPLRDMERLSVVKCGELYHLEFYGTSFGEAFVDLCETLATPEMASCIASLSLRGPDEGANGTRNWDLEPLVSHEQDFPFLQTLSVELTRPGDHNRTIIASDFDEDGVIARLVNKAPNLEYLTAPSAPSATFFEAPLARLRSLSIDAGYATQDFLRHFAHSRGFPSLRCMEWGEYSEHYVDNWQELRTPFSDYEELFASPAFRTVARFVLRQPGLSMEELQALKALRPDIQFLLVRYSDEYLRS